MTTDFQQVVSAARREGPRRFARWDDGLFDSLAAGPAHALAAALQGEPDAEPVLAGYLQLLQQGVGCGILGSSGNPGSFLERCLVERLPALLHRVPAGKRLPLLVKVWNLGEGLRREPAWLDRYVAACTGGLNDLTELKAFLTRTLEPVLTPPKPASWSGPFAVAILDLRPLNEQFLPGTIGLAAPAVLSVTDRRNPELSAGVLLRSGMKSELLGLMTGLGEYAEASSGPKIEFTDGQAVIAGQTVALPALRRRHAHAVIAGGFVATCAVDSQRLWILESP